MLFYGGYLVSKLRISAHIHNKYTEVLRAEKTTKKIMKTIQGASTIYDPDGFPPLLPRRETAHSDGSFGFMAWMPILNV